MFDPNISSQQPEELQELMAMTEQDGTYVAPVDTASVSTKTHELLKDEMDS